MSNNDQPNLIPKDQLPPESAAKAPPLTGDASIQAALGLFEIHMRDEGFAINTVKAFTSDIRLLGKFLGIGQPVGKIGTKNLNNFMHWLLYDRGVPCSPKSYARRVTTLKVFFGWLHKAGVLTENPSIEVIQRTVKSPLPTLPTEANIEKALAITQAIHQQEKPDARPHMLLTLLLQTGMKKSEVMTLVPNHINRDAPGGPLLFVRYANPRLRNKERKLYLEPKWLDVLDEYLEQYTPTDTLFTCTARNLEYVLRDVGDDAGLARGLLSFENLRWVSALRDHKADVEPDEIRQKLGLSKVTWRETKKKLDRLAKQGAGD